MQNVQGLHDFSVLVLVKVLTFCNEVWTLMKKKALIQLLLVQNLSIGSEMHTRKKVKYICFAIIETIH